ncbi:MAG: VOC family protein [Patulibacter sp.]|nr:VOC family protein [Patulibacter sp.]
MPLPATDRSARVASAPISAGPVALNVADAATLATFYREALGLRERADDGATIRLGTADRDLVALHRAPDAVPAPQAAGLFHLALLYPTRADLADAILRAGQAGARLDGASDHLVSEAVYLRDPEGNGIELYRDRDRDEWPADGEGRIAMDTLPLDVGDLLRAASDPVPPGVPGDTVVGHIHLQTADIVASRAFYADVLGFDVMVDSYPGALFVATDGYHHHIGLNVWNSRGRVAVPGARGLRHATLLLADADVRRRTVERLRAAGVAFDESADGAVTVRDPAGVTLRLCGPESE